MKEDKRNEKNKEIKTHHRRREGRSGRISTAIMMKMPRILYRTVQSPCSVRAQ